MTWGVCLFRKINRKGNYQWQALKLQLTEVWLNKSQTYNSSQASNFNSSRIDISIYHPRYYRRRELLRGGYLTAPEEDRDMDVDDDTDVDDNADVDGLLVGMVGELKIVFLKSPDHDSQLLGGMGQ